jgi:hypothetical protein
MSAYVYKELGCIYFLQRLFNVWNSNIHELKFLKLWFPRLVNRNISPARIHSSFCVFVALNMYSSFR